MLRVKAAELRKGDLIYIDDSYFEVMDDERYDVISAGSFALGRKGWPYCYVLVKCYMCPSDSIGTAIGACKYINIECEVVLLC